MDGESVRTFLYLRDMKTNAAIEAAQGVIVRDLKLSSTADSVEVIFGPQYRDAETIAVQTNSVMDVLSDSAAYIAAPESHIREGRTNPNRQMGALVPGGRPSLRVLSSESKPQDALVATQSRGYWFYIDDKDMESKEAFSFLMILMQLTAAQEETPGPVVTIGTGR